MLFMMVYASRETNNANPGTQQSIRHNQTRWLAPKIASKAYLVNIASILRKMNTEQIKTLNGQSYPHAYGYQKPQYSQIRTVIAFDGGNRFIKWIDPENRVRIVPSCVKEVTEYQWKRLRPDDQTVLIEVEGKRYVIGKLAQELGGEPTFQKDKCELAQILALVAIEPNPGDNFVHISKFAIALPDSFKEDDVAAVKRLENYPDVKEFKRNGKEVLYTIYEVQPVDETLPAFLYAKNQGFFSFPEHKNAVWDIGGGTSIARIYLSNGTLVQDGEVILPGTKSLAQQVAVEMKEAFSLDFSPALADIMDAISKGDCLYGTDRLNFSEIYQRACAAWVESARAEIRSKWAAHLPQLGEVLIVGGSAGLTVPICEASGDRFKIAPEPQLFNIIAMANLGGQQNG